MIPFGIASAPEFFQRTMGKILKDLGTVVFYMNGVLAYGKDQVQHWDRLYKVF